MQKIKVSKDIKIIGAFVLIAVVVGVLSWLLVKPERRAAGPELGDYSPQIVQDVSDTGEYITGVPGASTLRQNTQDNSIKTDANNLLSGIAEYSANNRGVLPEESDLQMIVENTGTNQANVKLVMIDAYSTSDVPSQTNEFYYVPGYTCESFEGPAKPGSVRNYVILGTLTRGKSLCVEG